jgi:predicted nucleic acid-binding protein
MAAWLTTSREVFLDTSYAIASVAPRDRHFARAQLLADHLELQRTRFVTTQAVILEIGNALARSRYRHTAVTLIGQLRADPDVEILPLNEDLLDAGVQLFQSRPDKEWGLIDCLSFVVMRERGLTDALTADDHFRQAGFRALLLEP